MVAIFYQVSYGICLLIAAVSIVASALNLFLIKRMNRWNVFIRIVQNLAAAQLFYDISFFLFLGKQINSVSKMWSFLSTSAGVATSIWTNLISIEILYVVFTLLPFKQVATHFSLVQASITLFSVLCGVVLLLSPINGKESDRLYFWFRIVSILFNIVAFCLSYYQLNNLAMRSSVVQGVLVVLVRKIKFYPIVQIVTRAGAIWYEYSYCDYGHEFNWSQNPKFVQGLAALLFCVLTPAGVTSHLIIPLYYPILPYTPILPYIPLYSPILPYIPL